MGIDDDRERPAAQTAGDADDAAQNPVADSTADGQLMGAATTDDRNGSDSADPAGHNRAGQDSARHDQTRHDPVRPGRAADDPAGHSEEWLANARQAGAKIRAMFKS